MNLAILSSHTDIVELLLAHDSRIISQSLAKLFFVLGQHYQRMWNLSCRNSLSTSATITMSVSLHISLGFHAFPYTFNHIDQSACASLSTAVPARYFQLVKLSKNISIFRGIVREASDTQPRLTPLNCALFMSRTLAADHRVIFDRDGISHAAAKNYLGETVDTYRVMDTMWIRSSWWMYDINNKTLVYGLISIYVVTCMYLY